jgi:annexin A7/11
VGTDEQVFNRILAHESFPQLKLIFEEYKNVSGRTIEQALQAELSGELLEAMLAIGEFVLSKIRYLPLLDQTFKFVTLMTICS